MQDPDKQIPKPAPKEDKEEKPADNEPKPEIIHIGSGGAFVESEGDIDEEQKPTGKPEETPY